MLCQHVNKQVQAKSQITDSIEVCHQKHSVPPHCTHEPDSLCAREVYVKVDEDIAMHSTYWNSSVRTLRHDALRGIVYLYEAVERLIVEN